MLSTAPGVFTSGEELKPSLLDDELIKDWLINYAPPTSISHPLDVTQVMNSPCFNFLLLFHFRVLLSTQTEE